MKLTVLQGLNRRPCSIHGRQVIANNGPSVSKYEPPSITVFTLTGIHINSLILEHNGNNYQFHGGTNDTIHVFTESIALYVLTVNKSTGTMGLNAFMQPEPDPINSVYLHNPLDIKETLGAKWERLTPKAITMKLIDYLM